MSVRKLHKRSYKSVQDYSNPNLHSHNTIFSWKKMVKKDGYCRNEGFGLAWDHVDLSKVALFITTGVCLYIYFHKRNKNYSSKNVSINSVHLLNLIVICTNFDLLGTIQKSCFHCLHSYLRSIAKVIPQAKLNTI